MADREGKLRSLLNNLRTGWRIGVMRPFDPASLRVDVNQVLLLFLISLTLGVLLDYVNVEPVREYNSWGLVSQLAGYIAVVFGVYMAVTIQKRLEMFALLLVALLAAEPVGYLIQELYLVLLRNTESQRYVWLAWLLFIVTLGWALIVPYWVQRRMFDTSRRRTAFAALVYFGVLMIYNYGLPHAQVWYTDYSDEEPPQPKVDVESTYYAQPALLKTALAALKPQRRGVHDIYFVGVAGWAEQDVFLREVRSVRQLFDEHYDTAGRSILLINNPATIKDVPLANAHNLQIVLDRIGRLMDPKEDMLFLYFTSHGSKDHRISMSYWPLRLNDIKADKLREILAGSRIGWKTVVISSCYSGGFIDTLKDEDSLIMTAAAANKTSFGCSNENAWTYFGEAYFKEALSHTPSLEAAFREAEQSIARREAKEKLTPSQPQIWIGGKMAGFLPKMDARLAATEKQAAKRLVECSGEQPASNVSCRGRTPAGQ